MKFLPLYFFAITLLNACGSKQAVTIDSVDVIPQLDGYEMVWNDEFNKEGKPDEAFWSYEIGLVRNNELQYYQPDNASVKDGVLIIEGRREEVKNPAYQPESRDWKRNQEYASYSSSSIHTRGKKEFQYGIVEVRAKIDTASGMWPAIWTLGIERGWPSNGEIDMMEFYRIENQPTILANAAWKGKGNSVSWDSERIPLSYFTEKDKEWANKFHIWKMDWTQDYIKLYLDGELLNETSLSNTKNPDGFNGFQQPHYILLNLALGSNGGDLSATQLPRNYEVDYVRVYQKIK